MPEEKSPAIYPRLCVAYFLEFAIWGSWAIALSGFGPNVVGFTPSQMAWLYTAIPLGAIISPLFIGPIADRYFAAQRVLGFLHLISGICLAFGGWACGGEGIEVSTKFGLLMTALLLHGILFMPTIALINSIVFKHLPNPDNAPRVFVFGTLGWIVINLLIEVVFGGMGSNNFFFVGGVCGILLGLYSFTLPDTPPSGSDSGSALGFDALKLLKDPAFAIFVLCAFLASIPACGLLFAVMGDLLQQRGYPAPLALGTLNQVSELFFMAMLPFFVKSFGLKRVLGIGMLAWGIRYIFFAQNPFAFAIIALLLHGFCYSFLYVGAYMYGDKKAPPELKASVQSLLAFLLLGVGQVAGAQLSGILKNAYPPKIAAKDVATEETKKALPKWDDPDPGAWRYLDFSGTVKGLLGEEVPPPHHLGVDVDENQDNVITLEEIQQVPEEGITYGEVTYTAEDLEQIFREIVAMQGEEDLDPSAVPAEEVELTRQQWLEAKAYGWDMIFYIPAAFVFIISGFFFIFGKDPAKEEDPVVHPEEIDGDTSGNDSDGATGGEEASRQ